MVRLSNHYYPLSTLKRVSVFNLLTLISTLQRISVKARVPKGTKGAKGGKVAKGAKGAKDAKVPRITRYLGSKGLLGDKVFSRTCV